MHIERIMRIKDLFEGLGPNTITIFKSQAEVLAKKLEDVKQREKLFQRNLEEYEERALVYLVLTGWFRKNRKD